MNFPRALPTAAIWGSSALRAPGHTPSLSGPPSHQPVCAEESPGWRNPRGAGQWSEGPHPAVEFPASVSHCTVKMSATPKTTPRILFPCLASVFHPLRFICGALLASVWTGGLSAHIGRHTNSHRYAQMRHINTRHTDTQRCTGTHGGTRYPTLPLLFPGVLRLLV